MKNMISRHYTRGYGDKMNGRGYQPGSRKGKDRSAYIRGYAKAATDMDNGHEAPEIVWPIGLIPIAGEVSPNECADYPTHPSKDEWQPSDLARQVTAGIMNGTPFGNGGK